MLRGKNMLTIAIGILAMLMVTQQELIKPNFRMLGRRIIQTILVPLSSGIGPPVRQSSFIKFNGINLPNSSMAPVVGSRPNARH